MAEPQPPTIHEGATDDIETTTSKPASSAEDRKAAAALSNLDSNNTTDNTSTQVDQAAATNALNSVSAVSEKKPPVEASAKSKVKVDAADVSLLVAEFEVSKARATELLRQNDGDAVKTIRAFLQPAF
ncbi:hypothetical protein QC763_103520 [Podospora pseudopauciseta]|uniref:Nascent polypeptide-associated complex subunit alpha-like UBA domain-containing protein n=1 Tax=Podospora pseudopauciseta TaxID=2093780 RepID=A0ABR0HX74_9PEZI|nr:hypothetical protein QC763_103520 [Podospora pseudopauciseta]